MKNGLRRAKSNGGFSEKEGLIMGDRVDKAFGNAPGEPGTYFRGHNTKLLVTL